MGSVGKLNNIHLILKDNQRTRIANVDFEGGGQLDYMIILVDFFFFISASYGAALSKCSSNFMHML